MYARPIGRREELINWTDDASNQMKKNEKNLGLLGSILIRYDRCTQVNRRTRL
jgi:hypothetical protein